MADEKLNTGQEENPSGSHLIVPLKNMINEAYPKILNDYRSLSNFCTFTDLQHIASYLLILCIYSIFCALSDT